MSRTKRYTFKLSGSKAQHFRMSTEHIFDEGPFEIVSGGGRGVGADAPCNLLNSLVFFSQDSWLQLSLDMVMRQQEHLHVAMEGSANVFAVA